MNKVVSIPCTVISPMFSYGNGRLEPRETEVKGLLRNTYRIANPALDLKTLYQREMMLFGGQVLEKSGEITTKASPLRIRMLEIEQKLGVGKQRLRLRIDEDIFYDSKGKEQKNFKKFHYEKGKLFDIELAVNSIFANFASIPYLKGEDPVTWYTELFYLSLVLGGIGKRSRRGRGCMSADALKQKSINELPEWVAGHLNKVCGESAYIIKGNGVKLLNSFDKDHDRPFIREVRFGKLQNTAGVNEYLKKVDTASHEIKGSFHRPNATGFVQGKYRFASSLVVSLTEVKEGIVPVYTLLNAASNTVKFYEQYKEQQEFIKMIEAGEKR